MPESTRSGVLAAGGATLLVLCCAGPALATTGAGLAAGAWLGAHGLWLLGALAIVTGAATPLVMQRRRMMRPAIGRVGLEAQRMGAARGAQLDPPTRELYHWILRDMADGRTPTADDLRDAAARVAVDAASALGRMASLDLVQLDDAGAVRCAYPFSAAPTGHEVFLSGAQQPVHAMCAVDALGIPYMLRCAAEITSSDPSTGAAVRVVIDPATEPVSHPSHAVVVVGTEGSATSCSASEIACPYISFFESEINAHAYLNGHPEITGTVLTMHDAVALGRAVFEEVLLPVTG